MKEALTANVFFNTIALARQNVRSLILVVEGDEDNFLMKAHVNAVDVLLIAGVGGRTNVLRAAALAEANGLGGLKFLVDADYSSFIEPDADYPGNVLLSKHHDAIIDVLVPNSRLVERAIEVHTRSVARKGVQVNTEEIRRDAYLLAASVAPLRIANDRNGYGLRLADFPFGELSTLRPSETDLADLVVKRSGFKWSRVGIESDMRAELTLLDGVKIEHLVGDHDLIRALAAVLRARGVSALSPDALWTGILLAMQCAHLAAANWYSAISDWALSNSRLAFACPCET